MCVEFVAVPGPAALRAFRFCWNWNVKPPEVVWVVVVPPVMIGGSLKNSKACSGLLVTSGRYVG